MDQWQVLSIRRFFRTRYVAVKTVDGVQVCFCTNGVPFRFNQLSRAEAHVEWLNADEQRRALLDYATAWAGWYA
ncbi:hypothetical protein [Paraburkholderia sp. A3RO-2L]|jgi:hypothetical protein|uniref:hypothetical protein n=1 Tax=unclassified Paraburkholderia TaxID=2615204 RepID=UPI0032F13524|nr:hypothetical protein [Burkholderia vietnamiensis]